MLSILLPSYNNKCVHTVKVLQSQCETIEGLAYEIIVADDGGEDMAVKEYNSAISALPNCRYIVREKNVGRAAIRNFLAQEAQGEWLLFLDSDVSINRSDFIKRYLDNTGSYYGLVDGGVDVEGDPKKMRHNLRFWYEYNAVSTHTAEHRSLTPHQHIHTANLLVPREVMLSNPFDERFTRYGYEDVLFGKSLCDAGISAKHIDNPVTLDKFEENFRFLQKTEESLQTLRLFRDDIGEYSILLTQCNRLKRMHLLGVARVLFKCIVPLLRRNLLSRCPSLLLFKVYKVGFYASLR